MAPYKTILEPISASVQPGNSHEENEGEVSVDSKPEAKTYSQVDGLLRLLIFSITRLKSTSCTPLLPVDGMGFGFGEDFLFDPFLHHGPHHDEHHGPHLGPHDYHHHHYYEDWHPFEYSYGVHDPHNHLVGRPRTTVYIVVVVVEPTLPAGLQRAQGGGRARQHGGAVQRGPARRENSARII